MSQFVPEVGCLKLFIYDNLNRHRSNTNRFFTLVEIFRISPLRLYHSCRLYFRRNSVNQNIRLLLAVFVTTKDRHLDNITCDALHLVATFMVQEEFSFVYFEQSFTDRGL